jgi:NitT/TauT family transport system permease protein
LNSRFGTNVLSILSLALVWEVAGRAMDSTLIPPLSQICAAWWKLLSSGKLLSNLSMSLTTLATGFSLAALFGVILGLLMGRFRAVEHFFDLYVNALMSAPSTAFVPVLILWFGLGVESRIAVVFLFAVFVIILDTQVGVMRADRSLVEMALSFGATRAQLYGKVLLLAALPEILAGLRLAAIRGVKGVVIGQLLVAILGVGELFELYSNHFLMEEFWALVIIVFVFAFAVSEAIAMAERRVEYYASQR